MVHELVYESMSNRFRNQRYPGIWNPGEVSLVSENSLYSNLPSEKEVKMLAESHKILFPSLKNREASVSGIGEYWKIFQWKKKESLYGFQYSK